MSRIDAFLEEWLGRWPPTGTFDVVPCARRDQPGWDGVLRRVIGVSDGSGRWVASVAPSLAGSPAGGGSPSQVPGWDRLGEVALRATESPAPLEPLGEWVAADDPVLPEWLRPFGGEALVVVDDHGYLAGVGLKRHLESGWEISVGTEPRGRGRGLARRLVATAASRVLDEGRAVLYMHELDNLASAAVADAAGFPDRGWRARLDP